MVTGFFFEKKKTNPKFCYDIISESMMLKEVAFTTNSKINQVLHNENLNKSKKPYVRITFRTAFKIKIKFSMSN